MTKKKGTKKSIDPNLLTPEYIEQQRRLREERKAREKLEKEAQGIFDSPTPEPSQKFIKRAMLRLPGAEDDESKLCISIMTYNILAQCLIRRSLFPTNGKILKWYIRSQILLAEIAHYDPSILCLQESDKLQYHNFWTGELAKRGYECKFYHYNTKNHGLVIAYKTELFQVKHQSFIKYDQETEEESKLPPARIQTKNVGLLCLLEFTGSTLEKFPYLRQRNGVIVGTTHAFWHPFGTYERTRQMYTVLDKIREFQHTMRVLARNDYPFYTFFTGDLNAEPFDAPYLSLVDKPVQYSGRTKNVLGCSLSYTFSKERAIDDEDDEEDDEKDEGSEESQETVETKANSSPSSSSSSSSSSSTSSSSAAQKGEEVEEGQEMERQRNNPDDPEPDEFEPTQEQETLIQQLCEAHNDMNLRAISLYSAGYKLVHEANAQNTRGEAEFSNWVDKWSGLLDYILVIVPWDKSQNKKQVDTPLELAKNYNVKLKKLLRLPTAQEMGPKPNGQPRIYQYPSDHLCIMAEIELE
ncbi:uncharacterized protein LODBEIA_P41190 [Lodderomyces beijingensis]|uniref:Endonuclease/exonuclease/phosphatase domain-containing protein n=1 Tax=Lodderomyces beijingensis TaxID=1775926 RepID=A0ABP0ZP10_9ASCO